MLRSGEVPVALGPPLLLIGEGRLFEEGSSDEFDGEFELECVCP